MGSTQAGPPGLSTSTPRANALGFYKQPFRLRNSSVLRPCGLNISTSASALGFYKQPFRPRNSPVFRPCGPAWVEPIV